MIDSTLIRFQITPPFILRLHILNPFTIIALPLWFLRILLLPLDALSLSLLLGRLNIGICRFPRFLDCSQ